jgi:hypothetical protein
MYNKQTLTLHNMKISHSLSNLLTKVGLVIFSSKFQIKSNVNTENWISNSGGTSVISLMKSFASASNEYDGTENKQVSKLMSLPCNTVLYFEVVFIWQETRL